MMVLKHCDLCSHEFPGKIILGRKDDSFIIRECSRCSNGYIELGKAEFIDGKWNTNVRKFESDIPLP